MAARPPLPHYSINYDGITLRMIIPSRKRWVQILLIVTWIIFWSLLTLGFLSSTARPLISSFLPGPGGLELFSMGMLIRILLGLFGLAWLAAWLLGGLYAIYLLLWQVIGSDVIEMNPLSIRIRRRVVGFERPKTYQADHIRALRVAPIQIQPGSRENYPAQYWLQSIGALAFNYGAETVRFGDLDKAEARKALADIVKRFPGYKRQ